MSEPEDEPAAAMVAELEPVVEKVSTEHGFDVRGYKRTTLYRRIRKRMADAHCPTVEDYLVRLETDPHEYGQLVNTILINVTEFFRDPAAWEFLQSACLEPLTRTPEAEEPLRVWSVGCATGEEAYSTAIMLAELNGSHTSTKIYATDMDEGALAVARSGVYDPGELGNVSPERRERFFEELPGGKMRVRREIRSMVIFGQHNVLEHAPISRLDLLVCRNLLIYFDGETQQQLLKRFHYAVRSEGYLFLGKAETLMSRSPLFRPVEPRHRIFQKVSPLEGGSRFAGAMQRLPQRDGEGAGEHADPEFSIPIGQAAAPILVLDSQGRLLGASPLARELFGVTDGHMGESLARLDERVRPAALRLAIEDARSTGREVRVEDLSLVRSDGNSATLSFDVRPFRVPYDGGMRVLLWGQENTHEHEMAADLIRVRQELETTSEELQTTNEELETTNEELQSTNEELETTNEELQSTNEELETTIEELQSTNEELETANDELRSRQDELNDRDRFQTMILSSLKMGVIVVWTNWEVTSWNRTCEDLWGLREEEAVGQNLFSLDTGMPFDALRKHLVSVIQGEAAQAETEVNAFNRRGKPIRCHVRVLPLVEALGGPNGAMLLIENPGERT